MSSNFKSHCATTERGEEGGRSVLAVQRKNGNWGRRGKKGGEEEGVEGKKSLSQQKFSLKF